MGKTSIHDIFGENLSRPQPLNADVTGICTYVAGQVSQAIELVNGTAKTVVLWCFTYNRQGVKVEEKVLAVDPKSKYKIGVELGNILAVSPNPNLAVLRGGKMPIEGLQQTEKSLGLSKRQ